MYKSAEKHTSSPSRTPGRGKKCYVVWEGRNPGIYFSWKECKEQVSGYSNNCYKGFDSYEEALAAYESSYDSNVRVKASEGPSKERCRGCDLLMLKVMILEAKVQLLYEQLPTLSSPQKKSVHDLLAELSEQLEKKAVLDNHCGRVKGEGV